MTTLKTEFLPQAPGQGGLGAQEPPLAITVGGSGTMALVCWDLFWDAGFIMGFPEF